MRKSEERRLPGIRLLAPLLVLVLLFSLLPEAAGAAADVDRIIVELQGSSSLTYHADRAIGGTNNVTRQAYKYKQERWGKDFHYVLSGLSRSNYFVEFSFFEPVYPVGSRIFSVYANASTTPLPGLNNLDIASKVGLNHAYQVTVPVPTIVDAVTGKRRLDLRFNASKLEATICNIRLIAAGQTAAEINVTETRHWSAFPLRFVNRAGQDVQEVILGRFGSRFMINPVPQLLAFRQSPLGTWTEELSELVLAFKDAQDDIRCLPFTDRYPVFTSMDQELTLTGVSYECRDPSLGFEATVTFTAPFYPEDVKLSSAPFFYAKIAVTNSGSLPVNGEFILVRPHKDASVPQALGDSLNGYKYQTEYSYAEESRRDAGAPYSVNFWEGLAVDDITDVELKYDDITDTGWIWDSPDGYPLPFDHEVYTFEPKGYSGLHWTFSLGAGGEDTLTAVLASHTTEAVLRVRKGTVNVSHYFLYRKAAGPDLAAIEGVVGYALGDMASIKEKSSFFDGILSDAYLSPLPQSARDLAAHALQSFIINAWWVYDGSGEEWFSVWEGTPCMFHSTIDVEYNDAWFYLSFWPDLLGKLLQEWPNPPFEKSNAQGKFLSHDMGVMHDVTGMAYPHDMPVEENANYILLLYSYWKTTGDDALMRGLFGKARSYTRFIFNCDSDGDGLPDLNVANTIDQGSPAVQNARNQTYLGVKALAAYRAAAEMARAQTQPDDYFIAACEARVRLINLTLEEDLWLDDHFAVCSDPGISRAEREAYSIYASNGLLYLLAAGLDCGLTSDNLERFRQDISSAAAKTSRRYGYVHTSVGNENQWVSQNLWRDALGYWLGVEGWPSKQAERLTRYWDLQSYYARKKNGGFWDVVDYRDYYFLGTSEAVGLGFAGTEQAASYLDEALLEAGGARGAYALDSAYQQSLGYYPRGTAFFSYINAMARLRLDSGSGYLLYDPAHAPGRVPVFSRAKWEEDEPGKRIPVLVFDGAGNLQTTINRGLLPAAISRSRYQPISNLGVMPFSCSPGTGSQRQQVSVSYSAPAGSIRKALVMTGSSAVRELSPGPSGLTWDGLDAEGRPVPDGVYTLYLETSPSSPAVLTPPATVQVGVNTNLPSPSTTWYLAEGYTGSNPTGGEFDTWVLIQNPGEEEAAVKATFMQPGGVNTERSYSVLPHSRFTIHVDNILPAAEVSTLIESNQPVVAERAVYFNGGLAGHDTVGANFPSQEWYLAEGYTGGDFDEWVLIQNPGDTEAALNVQFQTQDQGVVMSEYTLAPRSRFTIHVDNILADAQVSTYLSSNQPVVVERAQYLNSMRSGSCSIGARSPSYTWFFAEGYTAGGFEEWLLVQNPQDSSTQVDLTFMELDGTNTSMHIDVPARSRYTVPVHDVIPDAQLSVSVSSQQPVIAERAMYWKGRSDGHATLGTPTPEYTWFFAEGYTAEGYEEWLLIQNPWDEKATARLDFMMPGGDTRSITVVVEERSRFTIDVGAEIGATEVSTRLSADLPVVAERAMYFRERSGGHCSIGAIE
ncbi:MAG: DUF5719 family protein [Actinomycetota bacterium]|nr:DUF5719 family protein [Actinomycetota bacterium]